MSPAPSPLPDLRLPKRPRLRWPSGLRARVLMLVAVAVVPAMALLVAGGLQRRAERTASIHAEALNMARLLAQAQQGRLEGARQFLIALSRASDVRGGDPQACSDYMRSLAVDQRDMYSNIGVADLSGRVLCHTLQTREPLSVADRGYFQRAVSTGGFAVGEYMVGKVKGVPRLAFSYPLRDDGGRITSVLFATVDLFAWSKALETESLSRGATAAVLDRNGRIVARSADASKSMGIKTSERSLRQMVERGELTAEFPGADGLARVYGIVTVRDAALAPVLFVTVGLPRELVMAAADRRLALEVAALVGLALLSGLIAWYGADVLIRRPIAQLVAATSTLASGQLKTRANDVSGVREVVDLATSFNSMAERLQSRDLHLRKGQRMEAVGQLAGGIAHDFNNLLTVIIGYGEAIRSRFAAPSREAIELGELLGAADRAAKLTRQLLAFSRQQTLQPKPIHLNDVVTHMHSMLTRVIGEDIRLVTALGGDLGIIKADPSQLEQVLLNLVINARDAMPAGGTLTIETVPADVAPDGPEQSEEFGPMAPGRYAVLCVTDNGTGIDEATRARIFEPFFSTKGSMGTGLGLATVYGIVKQSGGYIWCDSEVGCGTRFSIYLPITAERVVAPRPVAPPPPAGGSERILVVEDEDAVRKLATMVLSQQGYQVQSTGHGREALEWLEPGGEPPDLLLVDLIMPEISGTAVVDAARRRHPGLRVMFMSGYSKDARLGTPIPEDAGYLQKPFTPGDLLKKVRETLDASTLRPRSPLDTLGVTLSTVEGSGQAEVVAR